MFTGIIEETGKLENWQHKGEKRLLSIKCKQVLDKIKIGDSIACNGICLTVINYNSSQITVEIMEETRQKTTAVSWQRGEIINLERALKLTDRLHGHLVQGHVDTTASVLKTQKIADTFYIWLELPQKYRNLAVSQGSIAVNGVSLTIARLEKTAFSVALINHTSKLTNLTSNLKIVNLEFDIIGKYIQRMLTPSANKNITMEWLREKDF